MGCPQTTLEATKTTSRSEFIRQTFTAASASILTFIPPQVASAAKYGGFGADSPEVIDPKTAIVDKDILASDSVQKSLNAVKVYLSAVKELQRALNKDSQANIGPYLRKTFDF